MSTPSKFPTSPFLFTVCQVGAEAALKNEIARTHPELRFAYSRPGFVTFKTIEGGKELPPDFELDSVFARAYGLSFGKIKLGTPTTMEGFLDFVRTLRGDETGRKLRLHVWERDQHFPGDEPKGFVDGLWITAARETIASAAGPELMKNLFESTPQPREGDRVVDLVAISEDEWWYGYHTHGPSHSIAPGGKPRIPLPEEAPSRAFVKFEEALLWSGAPLLSGDIAVEIGSAPGGASYALLQRGLKVVGIDPGEMDPRVAKNPNFRHFRLPVAQVLRETLPPSVEWLLLDMNVEPRISLFAVDRLATRMEDSLLGLLLTVKLNQWKIAEEIPSILEHVRAMGMVRVQATQLASNRQEIVIYGLTRKGLSRLKTLKR